MKNRVEVWRKMVVNIKLVKLTAEYKKQLTDMMDEWLAVEKDFSPYATLPPMGSSSCPEAWDAL